MGTNGRRLSSKYIPDWELNGLQKSGSRSRIEKSNYVASGTLDAYQYLSTMGRRWGSEYINGWELNDNRNLSDISHI